MDIEFNSYTVFHARVSGYKALLFKRHGDKAKDTVAVQHPRAIISRKDGTFTVQATNRANTRVLDLANGHLFGVDGDGKVTLLTVVSD